MIIEISESYMDRFDDPEYRNEVVDDYLKERCALRIRLAARFLWTHGDSKEKIAEKLEIPVEEVRDLLRPESEEEQENGYRFQCGAVPNGDRLPPSHEE